MIDPIIFTIEIGNFTFSLAWYGVLAMLGVAVAALLTASEFKRRGQDPDYVWDSLLWVLPAGVIGSRIWFVLNETLGGNLRYIQNPIAILQIKQGGLHYFGALVFGFIAFYFYAKKMGLDFWLAMDAFAPGLLLGQAIARPANFINQELYGQPTNLPWGIRIEAQHRIRPWNNMALYPEDLIRFHPTFAYEILWNLFATGILLILARKYKEKMKPGVVFGAWLILAGFGRNVIEFFRPDQPVFPGTGFSYSRLVAILMIIIGVILILIKYMFLKISFIPAGPDEYHISPPLEVLLENKKENTTQDEGDVRETEAEEGRNQKE